MKTPKPESLLSTLRKLLTLSERGIAGERDVAASKLRELLARHNLTIDDITAKQMLTCSFSYANRSELMILTHCFNRIRPSEDGVIRYKVNRRSRIAFFELNQVDEINLRQMWEHHQQHFHKEYTRIRKSIAPAYIQSNGLASPSADDRSLSREELNRLRIVIVLASKIVPKPWSKPRGLIDA